MDMCAWLHTHMPICVYFRKMERQSGNCMHSRKKQTQWTQICVEFQSDSNPTFILLITNLEDLFRIGEKGSLGLIYEVWIFHKQSHVTFFILLFFKSILLLYQTPRFTELRKHSIMGRNWFLGHIYLDQHSRLRLDKLCNLGQVT